MLSLPSWERLAASAKRAKEMCMGQLTPFLDATATGSTVVRRRAPLLFVMASTAPDALAPGRPVERSGASLTDGLLLAMAVIWGVNYSVVKYGTLEIAPLAYTGARIGLAAVALLLISLCYRAGRPSARDAGALVVLGMLGNGLYQLCFIEGISRSRVATVALVFAATPAFIAVAGRVRGSEHVSRRA